MIKRFVEKVGFMNIVMLILVLSIIITAEYIFIQGNKIDAIFLGLWAPTILGFMNYLKYRD
ncbi:MAG: hypothetical protein HKN48_08450 [Flavobacteriaceae bacterium]|nr:hypothetical protein [Flavobacteriaceae bacterium]